MNRVDIIAAAIHSFEESPIFDPDPAATLARHIDSHLAPEPGRIAHALERIARCVENIDARQANRDFGAGS